MSACRALPHNSGSYSVRAICDYVLGAQSGHAGSGCRDARMITSYLTQRTRAAADRSQFSLSPLLNAAIPVARSRCSDCRASSREILVIARAEAYALTIHYEQCAITIPFGFVHPFVTLEQLAHQQPSAARTPEPGRGLDSRPMWPTGKTYTCARLGISQESS
jgi:hypothetical protein